MEYIPTIGLEIHAELLTASKMFCSCRNNPDETRPNVDVCPICLGHPGTLPVLNLEAIRKVLQVGLAIEGQLADFTEWDRKNYFYPDIPKGYQISQFKYPLVSGGNLSNVEVERIHLEEDTAQSTHDQHNKSLVNFNRSGRPLMELVTKPVIHDAKTAANFAKNLQLLLRYLGAGEANMEKGQMRIEANISVAPVGSQTLGTKTEVKNLNSFRSVEKAIEYEIDRQTSLLKGGDKIVQETRGWDDANQETYSQRSKESSHDYRYFPEPDIPKLKLSEIAEFNPAILKNDLPELPWVKRDRYENDYKMTDKEVAVFVENQEVAKYFEEIISHFKGDAKKIKLTVNYLLNNYLGKIYLGSTENNRTVDVDEQINIDPISAKSFAELIDLIYDKTISSTGASTLIDIALQSKSGFKGSFKAEAEQNNLIQKSDTSVLLPAIEKVIADNATAVAEYKAGKAASLQFLIGQAMKATKGAGNPVVVKEMLVKKLG